MKAQDSIHDFATLIACMYRVGDPSKRLQDLLDSSSESYPRYICTSQSKDFESNTPLSRIYEHMLCAADSEGLETRTARVVCKVASSVDGKASLEKEAEFYEHPRVTPFWGQEIPRYFGLFQTPTQDSGAAASAETLCLVLEHGGDSLPAYGEHNSIRDQSLKFQMAVVEAYYRLHRATIYRDFGTPARQFCMRKNILVRDNGQPCLIDFARAKVDHECTIKGYSWLTTENRFAPSFGCEELHTVVRETDAYETEYLGVKLDRGSLMQFRYEQDKSAEDMVDEMNYDSDELEERGGREGLVDRFAQEIKRHEENLAVRAEKLEKEGILKHEDDRRHPDELERYLARQRGV